MMRNIYEIIHTNMNYFIHISQLTMATILSKYPDVFDDSVGIKLEGELYLYTKQDATPKKKHSSPAHHF